MKEKEYDIFVNQNTYPDPTKIFSLKLAPVDEIINNCIVVLDTNALLVPYSIGSNSLNEIGKVFQKLKKEERLVVPGQVAREFANNRPEKLKDLYQQLKRKLDKIGKIEIGNYPLLEGIKEYEGAKELEEKVNKQLSDYRKLIKNLKDQVKSWNWDDPVSEIYRLIFTENTILDIEVEEKKIKEDLEYRYMHKIPPGFKDGNKEDNGVGDLLIWLTILEIGRTEKDVIFVSGDEKSDWYHRSENEGLYPRFELLNEFKIASKGKDFHILKLSGILSLLGASKEAIEEVETEEQISNSISSLARIEINLIRAVHEWLKKEYGDKKIIVQPSKSEHDFEIIDKDGYIIGVEVIQLTSYHNILILHQRLNNISQTLSKNKKSDAFQIIIIAENFSEIQKNYSFIGGLLIKKVEELKKLHEVTLSIGFYNKRGRFEILDSISDIFRTEF